jgi:cation transport ATPase
MELNHLFNENFLGRIVIDILAMLVLVRWVYHAIYKKKDFFFTFFLFNLIIFMITYMLQAVEFSVGAAFGLFAVFSLLRYRTENISAKDMTYLFIVIALGLITAISKGSYLEISILDAFLIVFVYALDGNLLIRNEQVKSIEYRGLENIRPESHAQLIEDLRQKTGLEIHKVSIEKINFIKNTVVLKIYYYEK